MKNKTVILILSVLAVAMYTTAVINFCLGDVLGGIADVLMASTDATRHAVCEGCSLGVGVADARAHGGGV
jgi:hypothetical protein